MAGTCWRPPRPAGAQVDKILGPGNQYVTAAKMLLQNSEAMISIDMPAGPSEVLVIADAGAPHAHVAADLLSQAEHGPDSQVGRGVPTCAGCSHLPASARAWLWGWTSELRCPLRNAVIR